MTQEEIDIVYRFRASHQGHDGMFALADQLMELGFLGISMNQEQTTLRNYAIRVIEKMGVLTNGEKYQLCLGIAKMLQEYVVSREVVSGRE